MRHDYGKYLFWFFLIILALFMVLGFAAGGAALFGYIDWVRGGAGVILGALATILGIHQIRPIYLKYLERELQHNQLAGELERQLKEYFRNRLELLPGPGTIANQNGLSDISQKLMLQILRFLESVLRTLSPETKFEISVFANVAEPEIICYYDSGGSAKPSSADKRRDNPQFYREKRYEAVELLDNPAGGREVIVIPRIEEERDYSFRDASQRARIKSTCLCTFVDPEPMVIVLVANRSDVFDEADQRLEHLVKAALMSVAYERNICKAIRTAEEALHQNVQSEPA